MPPLFAQAFLSQFLKLFGHNPRNLSLISDPLLFFLFFLP